MVIKINLKILTGNFSISPRKFLSTSLLIFGTLAWFFLFQVYFDKIFINIHSAFFWTQISKMLFYGFGIFSALIGSLIIKKLDRRKFIFIWILLGIFSTILLLFFQGILWSIIASTLLGLSLGLGLPSCMAFLADYTTVEERGRVAGITILETFVMAFLTLAIVRLLGDEILIIVLLTTVIRSASLFALLLDKREEPSRKQGFSVHRSNLKEFIFYIFPWAMFALTSALALNLFSTNQNIESAVSLGTVLRYVFIAIFGVVWGVIADFIGRKQPIIIGLIILGVSFALLSFGISEPSVLLYLSLSGIAWGAFFTIYLVIPGDLSVFGSREKFYALGTISPIIMLFSLPMIDLEPIFSYVSISSFTQILSILLFLSIIPILRARETLLESKIRKRKFKEYTDRVGKIIQESRESNDNEK